MIRKYRIEDHSSIEEICRDIWDGNDYLPHIIDSLLENKNCFPVVLEKNGRVQSVANMRLYSDKIAWSEAMRTHPDFRGLGNARLITEYQISMAKELGCEELWLSTSAENIATRKLLERIGFKEEIVFYVESISVEQTVGKANVRKENIEGIKRILAKLEFKHLIGEYKIFPTTGDYINNYTNYLYSINNRSVFTLKPSAERKDLIIIGFNGHSDDISEVIKFTNKFNNPAIKIFSINGISTDSKFRFMKYEINK